MTEPNAANVTPRPSRAAVIYGHPPNGSGHDLLTFPTTPFRVILGIIEGVVYVAVLLACLVRGIDVNQPLAMMIGAFILVQQGFDVAQFGIKRATDFRREAVRQGAPIVTAEKAIIEQPKEPKPTPGEPTP